MKRSWLILTLLLFFLAPQAHAASVSISGISPGSAVDASTTVSFYTNASGFSNPTYAVSDANPKSGGGAPTIDKFNGYFSWTPTIYDAGVHTFTVTVTGEGEVTATANTTISVRNNQILLTALSPANAVVAVGKTFSLTIVAPGFQTPSYGVSDAFWYGSVNSGTFTSGGAFTWIPSPSDAGSHLLTFRAYDSLGHNGTTQQLVTVFQPSVAILSSVPRSVGVGSQLSFAPSTTIVGASWSVGDTFVGSTTVKADSVNASTGLFSWKPAAADTGTHTLVFTASDALGNAASTTIAILVSPSAAVVSQTPPPPTGSFGSGVSSSSYVFSTALAIGSRGLAVTELQKRLVALGYLASEPTGYYGSLTFAAVQKFQKAHQLPQVGVVGPATRKALNGQ